MSSLFKIFGELSYKSEIETFNKFINVMKPGPEDKILCIGGTIGTEGELKLEEVPIPIVGPDSASIQSNYSLEKS